MALSWFSFLFFILVVWYGMQCICFALISSLRDAKHEGFDFPTGCKVFERSLEVTSTKSKCVSVFQCIVWFFSYYNLQRWWISFTTLRHSPLCFHSFVLIALMIWNTTCENFSYKVNNRSYLVVLILILIVHVWARKLFACWLIYPSFLCSSYGGFDGDIQFCFQF